MSFLCSRGIFSDRETLEPQVVSLSFEDLLPRLIFTWLCFTCGTVPLVFICDYRKCRKLSEQYFFSTWRMSPSFSMRGLLTTHFHVSFNFIHYPSFVWTATPFYLFFWVELYHFSLCECHADIQCVSVTSKWTLHYVSFWVITIPFSFLSCVDYFISWTSHFLNESSTCPTSFLTFGNITNLFRDLFHILNVIIHLQLLDLFVSVCGIHLEEHTAWKVSKYGVFSGPYFPVFSPNTGIDGPEITPYLDTFHAVTVLLLIIYQIQFSMFPTLLPFSKPSVC